MESEAQVTTSSICTKNDRIRKGCGNQEIVSLKVGTPLYDKAGLCGHEAHADLACGHPKHIVVSERTLNELQRKGV